MVNAKRLLLVSISILFAFSIIAARLFFLQIWHHEEINQKVQSLICKNRPEIPCRGTIFDRQGRVMAMSLKSFNMFVDMNMVEDVNKLKNSLSPFGISLPSDFSRDKSFVPLAEGLSAAQAEKMEALKLPCLGFVPGYTRKYPEGNLGCYLLGVVGKDGAGLEGVEYIANSYLAGEKTKDLFYRDGRGREIADKLINQEKFQGADVYLTIDRNLQFIAEQEIEKAWQSSKAKKAIVIIQDPVSGELLALACRPAYNPCDFSGDSSLLRNPAVSDVYEPGSTFKLVTAAAALEKKAVKRNEVIWCEDGEYKLFNHVIKDHEKKGFLTFDQVMECSSNIGTAKVGQRLGKETLYKYIRQFGFYSKTGVDLPGEARGLLEPPEKWSGLSLPDISFGQGIGVTPIQLVNAYSSIANGGTLMRPSIIKDIRNSNNESIYTSEKKIIRNSVSPDVAGELREILTGIVECGTGKLASIAGYSIGGKTGTAQKRDPITKKYSARAYVSSFCGIVPVSSPRLTVLVILDEPKGDYYAASLAAPVFHKIVSRALSYLRIPPEEKPICVANLKLKK